MTNLHSIWFGSSPANLVNEVDTYMADVGLEFTTSGFEWYVDDEVLAVLLLKFPIRKEERSDKSWVLKMKYDFNKEYGNVS